ncbi:XRE family transcriptional regulator [Streptomyces viridochromogenes]|uniref:XRE family transcriptional regulator n=1 Tax=Streptomyces viridochromogenes TaxID=1938 RepID=A0A0J7Z1R8_STRVR|nr:helix-turn-helix transcriptional regulator [Streptomyces viridochromogenes]KMS69552.1 XRE family transcriptional regulator [Streptomyces viridochromogenes]KOG15516.1 XRE family transcriptional regulator [Streptomyces viridochromogenes]
MSSHVAPGDQATSGLDRRTELREFLRSRRARIRPEDVGLLSHGRRRVPGLRREELAQLAGVSYAYYARLEQGNGETMSAEVLDAVARALRLNEEEREHLIRLAQSDRQSATKAVPPPQRLRPSVQHLLDTLGVPAYVVSRRLDILGWNRLASVVFGDWGRLPIEERNLARLIFLSPEARDRFADPDRTALRIAGVLRMNAGRSPGDLYLSALIEELSQKSEEFRRFWARHEVSCGSVGESVRMRHPLVGEFDLVHEPIALPGGAPMRMVTYHAEPGSRSEEALRMLASWETEPLR